MKSAKVKVLKMKKHLAIFRQPFLDLILEGKKIIESRFSQKKISPYGRISIGDIVLMKKAGGKVLGEFMVQKILEFEKLTPMKLQEIKASYGKKICSEVDQHFWEKRSQVKYGTLLFINKVKKYEVPFSFPKKDRRAWVII